MAKMSINEMMALAQQGNYEAQLDSKVLIIAFKNGSPSTFSKPN